MQAVRNRETSRADILLDMLLLLCQDGRGKWPEMRKSEKKNGQGCLIRRSISHTSRGRFRDGQTAVFDGGVSAFLSSFPSAHQPQLVQSV